MFLRVQVAEKAQCILGGSPQQSAWQGGAWECGQGRPTVLCRKPVEFAGVAHHPLLTVLAISEHLQEQNTGMSLFLPVALQPARWAGPEPGLAPQRGWGMWARVLLGSQGGLMLFSNVHPPTPSDGAVGRISHTDNSPGGTTQSILFKDLGEESFPLTKLLQKQRWWPGVEWGYCADALILAPDCGWGERGLN